MTAPALPFHDNIRRALGAPICLIVSDFDGTLSPIAPTPAQAATDARAAAALRDIGSTPGTYSAVLSGRSLAELHRYLPGDIGGWIVGSHGAESELWPAPEPPDQGAIGRLVSELEFLAASARGALVEVKPAGAALHVRGCTDDEAQRLIEAARFTRGHLTGVHALMGHAVIEFSWWRPDKASALRRLAEHSGAQTVLFIGDDVTDEAAFEALGDDCYSVRVGPGPTAARYRLDSQAEVARFLEQLLDIRRSLCPAAACVPINRHSLLSDQRAVALVDDRARVVWMCLPRADSSAIFSELLGGPAAGSFAIEPVDASAAEKPTQTYLGDTMVLRSQWPKVSVTDYFDCSAGRAYQRAGRSDLLRVIEGEGRARVTVTPRVDFARQPSAIRPRTDGIEIDAGPDPLVLYSPGVVWTIEKGVTGDAARAEIDLTHGPVVLELRSGLGHLLASRISEPDRRAQTMRFWSGWAASLSLPRIAPEQAKRSAIALKSLCYGPTGAILAAATTSLPEQLGGSRNWDYRFCWPRDASLAAAALARLGNTGVAMKLLDWLVGVVSTLESPERLRPIYTVSGGSLWPEAEIGSLSGYAASRPVRIGNAADHQVQLDVFGPIVDLVAMLAEAGSPVTPEHWRLVQAMVGAVQTRWGEPDHGIWEIRGPKRHHVHSKVMCWQAATRGALIAELVIGRARPEWVQLADEIRADVLDHGYDAALGSFTSAYGSGTLDAANLWIVLSGMLPPDDPRAVSTVRAVQSRLREGPVVMRYREPDGLPGVEGGFVITAFWLAESLWMIGDKAGAQECFERAAALAGPTGLLAEQHDARTDTPLGNFPQAYSHLGLINAAVRLSGSR